MQTNYERRIMYVHDYKPQKQETPRPAALVHGKARPIGVAPRTVERGEPLDGASLAWSQHAFDRDFSNVRVHRSDAAAQAAAKHGANAFAVANDIYLGRAQRDLSGEAGRTLLAHELAHVVQQRRGRIDESRVEPAHSPAEREAHHAASLVASGRRAPPLRQVPVGIPRDVGWAGRGPIPDPYGMGYNDILTRAGPGAMSAVRDLASCEDRHMNLDRAKFDALTPDRRAAVLALEAHAKGTACENWFKTLTFSSGGGDFVMTKYDAYDGDPGNDTAKNCGIDLKITFTPAKTLRSEKISFVQIMKAERGGSPLLFANEKPRATTAAQGDEGWAVDRVANQKNADYQIDNSGAEVPDWGQIGHRRSDADYRDATLIDEVRLPRSAGQTFKVQATSFTLDKTNSKYLGGVAWGYDVDAKGKVTKKNAVRQSIGAPSGIQKSALEQWNAQAKNADVSKRNDPNQVEITLP